MAALDFSKFEQRQKRIGIHILLWIICILSVLTYRNLVLHGLDYEGKPPVPLRANPRLPVIGITVLASSLLFVGLAALSSGKKSALLSAGAVAALCLGTGAIVASIDPGNGSLANRDRSQMPFTQPPNPQFAISVLFPNADWHVAPSESRNLIRNLGIFESCGRGRIYVRGFASSAPFAPPPGETSDDLNKQLANARAREVQKVLWLNAKIKATLATPWESYDSMKAERRIIDLKDDGKRLLDRETQNRRAEVFWENSSCQQPLSSTAADPKAP